MMIENKAPSSTLMTSACSTSALASSRRFDPMARAMADEMPPPIAPAEIICISMTPGNTSAMPASASLPSREIHHVSMRPVEAWASITSMFGHERRSSVGTMGPCSSRRVLGSSVLVGIGGGSFAGADLAYQRHHRRRDDEAGHDGEKSVGIGLGLRLPEGHRPQHPERGAGAVLRIAPGRRGLARRDA